MKNKGNRNTSKMDSDRGLRWGIFLMFCFTSMVSDWWKHIKEHPQHLQITTSAQLSKQDSTHSFSIVGYSCKRWRTCKRLLSCLWLYSQHLNHQTLTKVLFCEFNMLEFSSCEKRFRVYNFNILASSFFVRFT